MDATIERRALVSQHQVGVDDLNPHRLQSYTVTVAYRFGQGARRDDEFRNKGRFGGTMRSVTRMTHEARRALSLGLVIAVVAGLAALLGPASPAAASGSSPDYDCPYGYTRASFTRIPGTPTITLKEFTGPGTTRTCT